MERTILVIEDHDDIATLTALMLKDAGYSVLVAGNGEEGLRLLEQHTVDLVILDIMLPGIDGWEVCRRLRTAAPTATLPILFFTVRSGKIDQHRVELRMVNGIIKKPFNRETLLGKVQAALAPHASMPRGIDTVAC